MSETQANKTYYDILDVRQNATPELIRTAYIMAKNTYGRDSLATYTLFNQDELRNVLDQLEEAYLVLSDPEKRRTYDESHGIFHVEYPKEEAQPKPAVTMPEPKKLVEPLDPVAEEKLQNPEFVDGPFLRMARESRKKTVDEIMEITKLNRNYVLALEEDRFEKLPAEVFVRGFVIQIAKALRLNSEKVSSLYMAYYKTNRH